MSTSRWRGSCVASACAPRPTGSTTASASRATCRTSSWCWRAGRVAGVRFRDGEGGEQEVACTLLVGADGRRSTVASLVGAWTPYRVSLNGRGLVSVSYTHL